MPNGTYGGVRGKETKIGRKTISFPYLLDYKNNKSYNITPPLFEPIYLQPNPAKITGFQI